MIQDIRLSPPNNGTIKALMESPLMFYQTGSRYMGCDRPNSDWDFLVQDSEEAHTLLATLDFVHIFANYTGDGLTKTIQQLHTPEGTLQVCLCSDVLLKRKCRDVVHQFLLEEHTKTSREEREYIWNTLAKLVAFRAKGDSPDDDLPF